MQQPVHIQLSLALRSHRLLTATAATAIMQLPLAAVAAVVTLPVAVAVQHCVLLLLLPLVKQRLQLLQLLQLHPLLRVDQGVLVLLSVVYRRCVCHARHAFRCRRRWAMTHGVTVSCLASLHGLQGCTTSLKGSWQRC